MYKKATFLHSYSVFFCFLEGDHYIHIHMHALYMSIHSPLSATEKISCVLKELLNQAGSQNNKLKDLGYSLKSLGGGFKSLAGDAYLLDHFNDYELEYHDQCLVEHIYDTLDELCDIKESVLDLQETVIDIQGVNNPCPGSGWVEIVNFDFTNPGVQCPGEWSGDGITGCGRTGDLLTISEDFANFSANGELYDEVCGRISAYAFGAPVAFDVSASATDVTDQYVDGVSLTHGQPPSVEHIWTFAAAAIEDPENTAVDAQCPCDGGAFSPNFIGENYFCEAGLGEVSIMDAVGLHGSDVLWDGEDCTTEVCCTRNTPPYFHRYLDAATTDDIVGRIMIETLDANVWVLSVELYVRLEDK